MHPIRVLFCSLVLFASQAFQLQASWSAPLTIAAPGFVDQPQVSINKKGEAIVVFAGGPNDSTTQIQAVTLINGVASPAHVFPLSDTVSADFANVAINKKGNAAIAWAEFSEEGGAELVASSFVKGFYAPPTVLSTNLNISAGQFPGVTLDSQGNGLACWLDQTEVNTISASKLENRTWQTSVPIFSSSDTLSFPVLAGNSKGDVIIAWFDLTNFVLQAAHFKKGVWQVKTFENSDVIELFEQPAPPAVSINEDGDAVICWVDNTQAIQAVRLVDGKWHAAKTLSDSTLGFPVSIDVALDNNGDAVANWVINFKNSDFEVGGSILQASRLLDGRWKNPVTLQGPTSFAQFNGNETIAQALVQIDSKGNAEAVWDLVNSSTVQVEARALNHGKWENFTILSNANVGSASQPAFSMNPKGDAVVVWNAGSTFIQATFGKHLFQR